MVSGGLALVALGMLMMTTATPDSSWASLLPGLLLAMIGTGMFNPAVIEVALGSVSEHQSGLAAGVNDTFRQAGIAVGVAALGALVTGGESYVDGFHAALWVGAAVAFAAAVATALLIRAPRMMLSPAPAAA